MVTDINNTPRRQCGSNDKCALPSPLSTFFDALNEANISWALLRQPNLRRYGGDIDLLVDPSDVSKLRRILEKHAFHAVPRWSESPNLLYARWCPDETRWLTLDILTELSFGHRLQFKSQAEHSALACTRLLGSTRLLAPEDAFWSLLLHCLLEKRSVSTHHARELTDLLPFADAADNVPRSLRLDDAWTIAALSDVAAGHWTRLCERRIRFHRAGAAHHRMLRCRHTAQHYARRLRAVLKSGTTGRAPTVALLGPNGVGKTSTAYWLASEAPVPVFRCYLGLWSTPGKPDGTVRRSCRILMRPGKVWVAVLRAEIARRAGRLVVFDRYPYDALLDVGAHHRIKNLYLRFLGHTAPRPTVAILLDAPAEVAYARKPENPLAEAQEDRDAYLSLREKLKGDVHLVDAAGTFVDVRRAVGTLVWEAFNRQHRQSRDDDRDG
jgi:hypothetical protein